MTFIKFFFFLFLKKVGGDSKSLKKNLGVWRKLNEYFMCVLIDRSAGSHYDFLGRPANLAIPYIEGT